jgi:hypothetical protein
MNRLAEPPKNLQDENHPINDLRKELTTRRAQMENIERLMQAFTERLYGHFEEAIGKAAQLGIPGLGKPRRIPHPAGGWRHVLQLSIEDWSIFLVPLIGAARPNPRDEARIPGARFKELCGRIALFVGDEPSGESFYDFLLFSDGFWFAWGYGWPRESNDIETTDFELMVFDLLASFVKDIHTTWRPRKATISANVGTALSQSMDPKKRAYTFGLPGEE